MLSSFELKNKYFKSDVINSLMEINCLFLIDNFEVLSPLALQYRHFIKE